MPDRQKILVVEGDRAVAMTLAATFRQKGWETLAAADAMTALGTAMKYRPDAIVLSAVVPGGALDTLKRMRKSVYTAVTPVVVVGVKDAASAPPWLEAGAQECLAGSLNSGAIGTALQRHLAGLPPTVTEAPSSVLHDAARLAALRASGLLDSAPEESYDRVTRLVAKLLGAPTALLSLVDKDRQFFKSHVGLGEPWATQRQTPLSHSFCQWVVSGREKIAINDARAHPLLRSNLAIRDLGVVAYAGVPVCSGSGQALGSLCAVDAQPREWSEQQLATLQDLTRLVEGCAAQAELVRQPPVKAEEFDRYVGAAGDAVAAAVAILRRHGSSLDDADRDGLLTLVQHYSHHLVQLNRMIQINRALN